MEIYATNWRGEQINRRILPSHLGCGILRQDDQDSIWVPSHRVRYALSGFRAFGTKAASLLIGIIEILLDGALPHMHHCPLSRRAWEEAGTGPTQQSRD